MSSTFYIAPGLFPLITFIIFALFVYLAIRSYRGKRIDSHPVCRQCKYDLVGTPTPYKTCPECGHDLSLPKHTRIGNRQRQTYRVTAFTIFAILSLLPLTIRMANFNLNPYKPFNLLLFQYMNPQWASDYDAVHREMMLRISPSDPAKKLTTAQYNQLFAAVLEKVPDRLDAKKDNNFYTVYWVLQSHPAMTPQSQQAYFQQHVQWLLDHRNVMGELTLARQFESIKQTPVLTDELLLQEFDHITSTILREENPTKWASSFIPILIYTHHQDLLSKDQQHNLVQTIDRYSVTAHRSADQDQIYLNFKLHINSNFLFYFSSTSGISGTGHFITTIRGYYLNDQYHKLILPPSTPKAIQLTFQLPINYGGGYTRNFPNIPWPTNAPAPKDTDTIKLDLELQYIFDDVPKPLVTQLTTPPATIQPKPQSPSQSSPQSLPRSAPNANLIN